MSTHVIHDTTVLTKRSLRHILRSPDTILTTAVTPIVMLLLFVYVFGGAIVSGGTIPGTSGDRGNLAAYVDYLLPGILLVTVASGIAYTAFRLFTDVSSGIFERFQSMPIARSAVLWGHILTSIVANLISLVLTGRVALVIRPAPVQASSRPVRRSSDCSSSPPSAWPGSPSSRASWPPPSTA